jgi:protein-tyrosine-phosphatase
VARVNRYAVEALQALGIDWRDKHPKPVDDVIGESWDIVITVCDCAKESCPTLPGRPASAHWGLDDPAAVEGDEATVRAAFRRTGAPRCRFRVASFDALVKLG